MDVSDCTTEIWKPILKWESLYEVSNLGRVRRLPSHRLRKPRLTSKGYLQVGLYDRGRQEFRQVHCYVAEVFISPRPEGKQVNHKDTDKTNNIYCNLEWTTCQENVDHAVLHGLTARGDRSGRRAHPESYPPHIFSRVRPEIQGELNKSSKLTNSQVTEIKEALKRGRSLSELGRAYGVLKGTISKIKTGRSWTHIRA